MKKLPILFVCSLVVCWATVAIAWAIGLAINCIFIDGCYGKLGIAGLMKLMDMKSVLVRGTLLSLIYTLFAWVRLRRN
jgi:phosphotransferase system  glucose/maltose/N-acetylglucosamine-specific IIC component